MPTLIRTQDGNAFPFSNFFSQVDEDEKQSAITANDGINIFEEWDRTPHDNDDKDEVELVQHLPAKKDPWSTFHGVAEFKKAKQKKAPPPKPSKTSYAFIPEHFRNGGKVESHVRNLQGGIRKSLAKKKSNNPNRKVPENIKVRHQIAKMPKGKSKVEAESARLQDLRNIMRFKK